MAPHTGSESTLLVRGTCSFPTPVYEVELRPKAPQGINPKDLLLDLVVLGPETPGPETGADAAPDSYGEPSQTDVEVIYVAPAHPRQYDTVTVVGEGGATVRVEEVS